MRRTCLTITWSVSQDGWLNRWMLSAISVEKHEDSAVSDKTPSASPHSLNTVSVPLALHLPALRFNCADVILPRISIPRPAIYTSLFAYTKRDAAGLLNLGNGVPCHCAPCRQVKRWPTGRSAACWQVGGRCQSFGSSSYVGSCTRPWNGPRFAVTISPEFSKIERILIGMPRLAHNERCNTFICLFSLWRR